MYRFKYIKGSKCHFENIDVIGRELVWRIAELRLQRMEIEKIDIYYKDKLIATVYK